MGAGASRRQCATALNWAEWISGGVQRGEVRLSALQTWSPQPYLQSPKMYFHAHCNHSLPRANVSSETTQPTQSAPKAFESSDQARYARCTFWSSTNGSVAIRCCAEPSGAQAGAEAVNRCRMTIKGLSKYVGVAGASSPAYNPP